MDLERQPQKGPQPPPSSPKKIYQARPSKTFIPIERYYAQEVCVIMGTALAVIGLVGFVVDNFLGAHLSYLHNALHLATGALALWFGFDSIKNARRVAFTFGTIYGLVGLAGFFLGSLGMPTVGSIQQDRFLWKPFPENLELGTTDHTLHLVTAGIFILGAALKFKRYRQL